MKNRFLRLEKISRKLTLVYSLLFSFVLLLLSFIVLYGARYYIIDQAYESVKSSTAETISMILDTDSGNLDLSNEDLLTEARSDSNISITIANANGKIVNQSDNLIAKDNDLLSHLNVIRRFEINGAHWAVMNSRVSNGASTVAYLQIAFNMETSYRFVGMLFGLLAVTDSIGILLSILIGNIVSKRMLIPINRITKTAQSISIYDLGSRIPINNADDEITRLAMTINHMLDRLQNSINKQIQFVSDASHELRTPISIVLGYVSLLNSWGKDDKTVLQESLDAIQKEALDMRQLAEKLLFLARNDSGRVPVNKEPFDVCELTQEVVEESKMIAPEMNIQAHCSGSFELQADRNLVKQMLRSLVDNSIKFTNPTGEIHIYAATHGEKMSIVVEDNGVGVPADEREHVFDRFYRVDKARSKETGGSGLGLSIVKSIVDLHGGDISIDSAQSKGTRVTIDMPMK